MARNRAIKSELWSDEKLSKLCPQARLLYLGLWDASDNAGVAPGDALWLKAHIFVYDQISTKELRRWLRDLVSLGRIIPYRVKGEQYYVIPEFSVRQKMAHPQGNPLPPLKSGGQFARRAGRHRNDALSVRPFVLEDLGPTRPIAGPETLNTPKRQAPVLPEWEQRETGNWTSV